MKSEYAEDLGIKTGTTSRNDLISSDAVLADVRADFKQLYESYISLLEDAKYMYNYYPNNFRRSEEEYFKKENELLQKISEHFS
jgi:hypothetical protein